MNQYLLKNFDNNTLNYNLDQFNWPAKVLEIIQEHYPSVTSLEHIHKDVAPNDISKITGLVQNAFLGKEPSTMLDDFAEEYIKPLIGDNRYLIKRFPTLNLVVPNQEKLGRRLHFHQGIFYNNGRGQGTIWMPLTECFESNSMWVVDYENSVDITKKIVNEQTSQKDFEKMCMEEAYPVTLSPGQAHLFHQEIIHGNINNKTEFTRMAIDWHVLVEGEEFNGRYPGGFFRLPKDYKQKQVKTENAVIYLSNNSSFDKHIPIHIQRNYIVDYCKNNNIQYSGYVFENEHLKHQPILKDLIQNNQNIKIK